MPPPAYISSGPLRRGRSKDAYRKGAARWAETSARTPQSDAAAEGALQIPLTLCPATRAEARAQPPSVSLRDSRQRLSRPTTASKARRRGSAEISKARAATPKGWLRSCHARATVMWGLLWSLDQRIGKSPTNSMIIGAPGEIRTPTPFRASDFESPASTVPPRGPCGRAYDGSQAA